MFHEIKMNRTFEKKVKSNDNFLFYIIVLSNYGKGIRDIGSRRRKEKNILFIIPTNNLI